MPYRPNALHDPETQPHDVVTCEDEELQLFEDLTDYFKRYTRQRPKTIALVCLGLGFVLGWKLKPW